MTPAASDAARAGAPGGLVSAVEPGSAADRAGVRPGDTVLAVDGAPVLDILDWRWRTTEESLELTLRDASGAVRDVAVDRAWDEPVGIDFAAALFDGVHTCENACTFCFVQQLPAGLRPSLYVRDDDFRLSFLQGNFVTLTNLTDAEAARIVEQRLSPLHVSVHAADAEVRRRLLCSDGAADALERVRELAGGGIEMHVQIVAVPGVNDGAVLDGTLQWLARLGGGIASVGVVPLGLTAHQTRFEGSFDAVGSEALLDSIEPWRRHMTAERGIRWVHAADELHLSAGRELPPADEYDGYPQFENGIGIARAFIDEWAEAPVSAEDVASAAVLVTGELAAPVLAHVTRALAGAGVRVLPVRNALFGGNVSVAGLLAGRDLADAIRADAAGAGAGGTGDAAGAGEAGDRPARYLVPDVVLNDDGVTLDDVPGAGLAALTGADVRVVSCDAAGLADALRAET